MGKLIYWGLSDPDEVLADHLYVITGANLRRKPERESRQQKEQSGDDGIPDPDYSSTTEDTD